jgi:hypothetical protein
MNALAEKTAAFLERFLAYAESLDEWLDSASPEGPALPDQQRFTRSLHRFAGEWSKLEAQWQVDDNGPARKEIEELLRKASEAAQRCQARIDETDQGIRVQLDAIREELGTLRGGRTTALRFKSDVDNAGAIVDREA